MSMKSTAMFLLGAAAMMSAGGFHDNGNSLRPQDISGKKKVVVPKGCERYFFNERGGFMHHDSQHTVFDCIARTPKKAIEKYNTWKTSQGATSKGTV